MFQRNDGVHLPNYMTSLEVNNIYSHHRQNLKYGGNIYLRDLDVEGVKAAVDIREVFEWTAHQLFKKDIGLNAVNSS